MNPSAHTQIYSCKNITETGRDVRNYCTCGHADASYRLDTSSIKPGAEEGAGRAG